MAAPIGRGYELDRAKGTFGRGQRRRGINLALERIDISACLLQRGRGAGGENERESQRRQSSER